jgi:hypothetical protein
MKIFIAIALGLISGFYIKSNYFTKIQTPNSPPTFNFTLDQLKEIEEELDITIGEYPENPYYSDNKSSELLETPSISIDDSDNETSELLETPSISIDDSDNESSFSDLSESSSNTIINSDNLTIEELREILITLERGEELEDFTRNRLNNDFYNLLEQENFDYDGGDLEIQEAMSAILDILDQTSNFF